MQSMGSPRRTSSLPVEGDKKVTVGADSSRSGSPIFMPEYLIRPGDPTLGLWKR